MRPFSPRWGGWQSTSLRTLAGIMLLLAALVPVRAQAACGAPAASTLMVVAKVPDLKGCTLTEARRLLISRKLRLATTPGQAMTPDDVIDTQSPDPGEANPPDRTVTVAMSINEKKTPPPPDTATEIQVAIVSKEAHTVHVGTIVRFSVVVRNAGTAPTLPLILRLGTSNFDVSAESGLPEGCASFPCKLDGLGPGDQRAFSVAGSALAKGTFHLVIQADDDRDRPGRVTFEGAAVAEADVPQDHTPKGTGDTGKKRHPIAPATIVAVIVAVIVAMGIALGLLHRWHVRRRWMRLLRFSAMLDGPAVAHCGPVTPAAPPLRIAVQLEAGESRVGSPLPITATRN